MRGAAGRRSETPPAATLFAAASCCCLLCGIFVEETSARIVSKSLVASARNVASSVLISLPKSAAGSAWCLVVVEHAVTEYFVAPTITAFTACSPLAWIL
jgi:hypothetical protein